MLFCLFNNLISSENPFLPARESTLIHFVTHLANSLSYGTIKVYLAAANNLHIEFGCPLELSSCHFYLRPCVALNAPLEFLERSRPPITVSILHKIYLVLQPFRSMDMDSSMLLLL